MVLSLGSSRTDARAPIAPHTPVIVSLHGHPVGATTTQDRDTTAGATLRRWLTEGGVEVVVQLVTRWRALYPTRTPLELLIDGPPQASEDTSSVTVAICTRDRPQLVANAIRSVLAPSAAQVMVVDNAPATDATRRLVTEQFPGVRYYVEPRPGLDHARNRALQESTTDVVAYLDDDATALPGWVARTAGYFARNPDLSLMFGRVEPESLVTDGARLFEAYHGFARGVVPRWHHVSQASERAIAWPHANTGALGTGASLAVRRTDARALGGFDPDLDAGTPAQGGGDLDLSFRVLKAEGLVLYEPSVVVTHRHRATEGEVVAQVASWGTAMGAHLARVAAAYPEERAARLALMTWLTATWHLRRWLTAAVRDPRLRRLVEAEVRGLWRGHRLYPTKSPVAPRHLRGLPQRGLFDASLEVGAPVAALHAPGHGDVRIHLRASGNTLASCALPLVGGWCGADRLVDALAQMAPVAHLGVPVPAAAALVRRILTPANA